MTFKFNISHQGKTLKRESENETFIGKKIGNKIHGKEISEDLDGYELEITGTSDLSGFAGKKGLEGTGFHKSVLTYGFGMKKREKGLRLRKTLRGEQISHKTIQINTKVLKEGSKKFEDLLPKKEEAKPAEQPAQ